MNKISEGKDFTPLVKIKINSVSNYILFFIFFALVITSFFIINFEIAPSGFEGFKNRLANFFKFENQIDNYPNKSLFVLSFEFLWISIRDVLIGTTLGFIIALITTIFANEKIVKLKVISWFFKIIIPVLRAMPVIFFIYVFSTNFSANLALILVYMWFTWIWSHKYISQYYESISYDGFNYSKYEGKSYFLSFYKNIWYQINNKIISLFLYSFESNMRWSSILGSLGLTGIGELIYKASDDKFESMGIPVLVLTIFMIFLEVIFILINKFILENKSFKFVDFVKQSKTLNIKKQLKKILFITFLVLLIASFVTINWSNQKIYNSTILSDFFKPNWNVINENKNINLPYDIFYLIVQTFLIMFIAFIISIFFVYISAYKIFGKLAYIGIVVSTIARAIPLVLFIYLFSILYANPEANIILILSFYTGLILAKNFGTYINSINDSTLFYLKMCGYSKNKIFFKYCLNRFKFDFRNLALFNWESQFRDLITYGQYGSSMIGVMIEFYFNSSRKEFDKMATFIWISFFINLIAILCFYLINNYHSLNKLKINLGVKKWKLIQV